MVVYKFFSLVSPLTPAAGRKEEFHDVVKALKLELRLKDGQLRICVLL
jgi:hypothetical protein